MYNIYKKAQLKTLSIDDIDISEHCYIRRGYNIERLYNLYDKVFRETDFSFKRLCESIIENGLQEYVFVRENGNRYELFNGVKRFLACKLIYKNNIPCLVLRKQDISNAEMMVVSIKDNILRDNMPIGDKGMAISKLINTYGFSKGDIKQELCISLSDIEDALYYSDNIIELFGVDHYNEEIIDPEDEQNF